MGDATMAAAKLLSNRFETGLHSFDLENSLAARSGVLVAVLDLAIACPPGDL
jgi:hypothetical protein